MINEKESKEDKEVPDVEQSQDKEEQDGNGAKAEEIETPKVRDEDLLKVIRYLIAAGCDVNMQVSISLEEYFKE